MPFQKIDIVRTVIAAPATTLERLDLRETGLPESQHVLGQIEIISHFADGAESLG